MAAVLNYKVTERDENKTVERVIRREFGISAGLMKELKLNGKLFLNGAACRSIDKVKTDDVIKVDVSEENEDSGKFTLSRGQLDILYEDDFLIVVNKAGGVESHPCPSNRLSTLANEVMYYWAQKGEYHNYHIVNRLDKDTSGICVIAKNRFTHGCLSKQMKEKDFKKKYFAVVHKNVNPPCGVIEKPIKRKEGSVIKREVSQDGKYAKTVYRLADSSKTGKFSLVEVDLETGRTHQIRVHFSHIGCPLVGDWLYGNGDNERDLIKRHALHAGNIEFVHPATKEKFSFETDIPKEMKKLMKL